MSNRYIIIPQDAEFLDPHTNEPVKVGEKDGEPVFMEKKSFDWWLHVYILSHLQFSVEVGGYDATKARDQIAKSLTKAMDSGASYFSVTADQWRRLNICTSRAVGEHADELYKEKPNTRILAMSSHGMTRPMDNFSAGIYMEFLDAIANASTNEPVSQEVAEN